MPRTHVTPVQVEDLTPQECRRRLAEGEVGRVVVQHRGRIHVLPVNYADDAEHAIVFRSARGTKLEHARRERRPVSFSVGETEPDGTTWWVTVTGELAEVLDLTAIPALSRLELDPWADAVPRIHWLRLRPIVVAGGRVRLGRGAPIARVAPDLGREDRPVDRGGLEVLTTSEAQALALAAPVGRLAFVRGRVPLVGPVMPLDWTHDLTVLPLTDEPAARWGDEVTFEVDGWDAASRTGWSVVAHGRVEQGPVPEQDDPARHPIRLRIDVIEGRRIPGPPAGPQVSGR